MAGCEKTISENAIPTRIERHTGTSQFPIEGGPLFTSSKTSPGVAMTLNNREVSDVEMGGGGFAGGEISDGSITVRAVFSTECR